MKDKTDLRDPMGVQLEPADKTTNDLVKGCLILLALFVGAVISIIIMTHNAAIPWK